MQGLDEKTANPEKPACDAEKEAGLGVRAVVILIYPGEENSAGGLIEAVLCAE